jgi:PPK2 family polyphosphate:nucleotide phosphotransferase
LDQDAIRTFARELDKPYRITNGAKFRLKDFDPGDTGPLKDADKPRAQEALQAGRQALAELQTMLYAQDRWSVLLIFQAMDAAGKDGAIRHVMSGVDPQGVQVHSFKAPSAEELDHDFLWRCWRALPERGRIGIFNRSYYEEVLVVRVHREILEAQKLPKGLVGKKIWDQRYEAIRAMELHLARSGTLVLKFFLHMSKEEQKKQFMERIEDPAKNWKFAAGDVKERQHWDAYMDAYEAMIRATSAPHAPWYVVPADNKWYTRTVVAAAIVDGLASLDLHFPELDKAKRAELAAARKALLAERS